MAKVLAFQRTTSSVVTIDTVNNTVSVLGAAIPDVEPTNLFPLRSQNLLTIYKGDPYFLYLHDTNEIRMVVFQSGTWSAAPGFTAVLPPAGVILPVGLQVVNDILVAVMFQGGTTGFDGILVRRTTDGVTWDATQTLATPTQPTTSDGGHTVVWRDAVWFATAAGLGYYLPATDTLTADYDIGDDSLLFGDEVTAGNFAFWNNDLYFCRADSSPRIYRLASDWTSAAPTAAPAWTRQLLTGLEGVAGVNVGPDSGTFCMFVNRLDELCLFYSGTIGTKLAKTTAAEFPAFTDITVSILPESLRLSTNIGVALSVDDRRSVNELQTLLLWVPGEGATKITRWDGATAIDIRTTLTGVQVMAPNARFGSLRTFTNLQPTAHITAVSQVFPGRQQLNYTVRDSGSKPVDVFGEYSIDGDVWSAMTQGDGDSGGTQLATSPTGTPYTFFWDAFVDLDGDFAFMNMRIVARIAGV